MFHALVVGAGVVAPTLALWVAPASVVAGALAAAGVLAGFLAFRILILRVGVYEPVLPF